MVILEPAVVRPADIGFDMTGARLHRHESGPEQGFIVPNGVIRRHGRVNVAFLVIGEDAHLDRNRECLENLRLVLPLLFQHPVAVAPAARLPHDTVPRLLVDVIRERLVRLALQIIFEILLQIPDPFRNGLLGIFLHLVINGSVHTESVLVEVVAGAVGLPVLLQPTVQIVRDPSQ